LSESAKHAQNQALLTIKKLHACHGHIQEVIIQNLLPKQSTKMRDVDGASFEKILWTLAAMRLLLGSAMHIQAPPNLSFQRFPELIAGGIDERGGVRRSPLILLILRPLGARSNVCGKRQNAMLAPWLRVCRFIRAKSTTRGLTSQRYSRL
jgi:hypothetical protein